MSATAVKLTGKIYDFIYKQRWYCILQAENSFYAIPFVRKGDYLLVGEINPDSPVLFSSGDSKLRGIELTVVIHEACSPGVITVATEHFAYPVQAVVEAASCVTSKYSELQEQPARQLRKRTAAL